MAAQRDLILNIHEKRDGNAMLSAANDLEKLSRGVDAAGHKFSGAATDLEKLDKQIVVTKERIKDLRVQFARTGDTSLFGDLRKEEANLRNLERTAKGIAGDISAATRSANSLSGVFSSIGEGASGGGGAAQGAFIGGLVALLAASAPALGAMLAGIVAGTIGTGGVAGGLLMASHDPHVKDAASKFFDSIKAEFFSGGDSFVRPAIQSLNILEDSFKNLGLGDTFAKVAPEVTVIAHGLADLAQNIMPGLNKAFDRMGPFADSAAEGFAEIGTALSEFLDDVTASPGAVMGLDAAFRTVSITIEFLGNALKWLSDRFADALDMERGLVETAIANPFVPQTIKDQLIWLDTQIIDIQTSTKRASDGFADGTDVIQTFGEAVSRSSLETQIFADALDDAYTGFLKWSGAEVNVEQALDDLQASLEKNGVTWDADTQAGRDNVRAMEDLAQSALDAAKAKYEETGSVEEANKVYDKYRQKLYDMALAMTGNADEAQALTDKWLGLAQLQDIEKTFTIHEKVIRATYGPSDSTFGGGLQEFDSGGMVKGPMGSPQMVIAHAGERVLTSAQQAAMWAGGGDGGAAQVELVVRSGGSAMDDLLVQILSKAVQVRGGDGAVLGIRTVTG